jgi:pyridoxal phosphate enzyme (YggS family)
LIAANLKNLQTRIREACLACGRDPDSVKLLAVSKLHPLSAVRAAFAIGQRDFAENYVQEAVDKMAEAGDLTDLRWHFIGRIQSNKVKFLGGGRFAAIHSIDRASIAEALNHLTLEGTRQDIFLQFNVAAEPTKGGIVEELELENLFHFIVEHCPRLRILGLMVMPPLDRPPRAYFARARTFLLRLRGTQVQALHPLDQLSMGTSRDFAEAIAEGATWIRIGTEIFGERT